MLMAANSINETSAQGALVGMDQKEWYIGEEALSKKQFLNMEYPVVGGRIQDMG
jgi:hypothetical protein